MMFATSVVCLGCCSSRSRCVCLQRQLQGQQQQQLCGLMRITSLGAELATAAAAAIAVSMCAQEQHPERQLVRAAMPTAAVTG
jgi:hypothetical protein